MRVAIYVRSSRGGPDSLGQQARACRARASEMGWSVVGVWADEAIGRSIDLPGIASLCTAVGDGEVDAVLALRPDRFGGQVEQAREIEDRLRRAGAEIAFAEGYDVARTLDGPHVVRRRMKQHEGAQ